jgi:UDP-N-acetylmuramyl tripeptide synthase
MELLEDLILFGPNRRSENTLIELWLLLSEDECRMLEASAADLQARILALLEKLGLSLADNHPLRKPPAGPPAEIYARLVAGITLALQQHAGHRVNYYSIFPVTADHGACVAVEYEHDDSGDDAKDLAFHLLSELEPGIKLSTALIEHYQGIRVHLDSYLKKATAFVLPRDSQFIIDAAARLDIPCVKLEREPYAALEGSFRVRPNGLLKLGHACRQQVIDGTFCIHRNKSLFTLLTHRQEVRRFLVQMDVPVARQDPEFQNCITSKRAARVAERVGFPVVIKPLDAPRSVGDSGVSLNLGDAVSVRKAAEAALRISRGVQVEAHVPGETFKVIVANGELVALVQLSAGEAIADVTNKAHPSILETALRLASRLEPGLMTLTLVSTDISQPLEKAGAVVNMDIAPELDAFLGDNGDSVIHSIHEKASEGLLRFLFPEGVKSRIPLIAVTGTNGKTTICAMIAKVMQAAGYVTGRAGTTGFIIDNDCLEFEDFSGGSGHHKVLESAEVECAVLESARGAASGMGFMYDWSDIAVCSNVTADHLHERGIETVEQMAELKMLIMKRARHAVVLNADAPLSASMLPELGGRTAWMVSARETHEELHRRFGAGVNFAVAETHNDTEWVYLYEEGGRTPVMPIAEIPTCFDGRARFNVSNALQAIATCYQQGVSPDVIRSGMSEFRADQDTNPGRLNFYHGLPFTVLMDYAHNADGHRQLQSFVETLEVPGRKIIAFAVVGRMNDDEITGIAAQVAGAYDYFVCRNYPKMYGREIHEVPDLIRQGLMEKGVPESCILQTLDDDYIEKTLAVCRPGDLLVYCASAKNMHKDWADITAFSYEGNS